MRIAHLALGLAAASVGAAALLSGAQLQWFGEHGVPGPGLFPSLVALALVALGLVLATVSLARRGGTRDGDQLATGTFDRSGLLRAGRVWVGFTVAIGLLAPLGFVPAMVLLLAFLVLVVERQRGIVPILTVIILPTAVYLLFTAVLGVDLPASELLDTVLFATS